MHLKINERIKEIRKQLKMSQTEFASRLGISRDAYANIELGRVNIKETYIILITKEFDVNPLWLTEGKGDIFLETEENIIEDLATFYNLNKREISIIKNFVSLDEADRKNILDFLDRILKET